jgi:hypothetical protein
MEGNDKGWFTWEGDFLVREFGRTRTPTGAVSRMDVDSLRRLTLRPAPEIWRVKLGSVPVLSGAASALNGLSCGVGTERAFDDLEPAEVVLIPN